MQPSYRVSTRTPDGTLNIGARSSEAALVCARELLQTHSLVFIEDQHGSVFMADTFEIIVGRSVAANDNLLQHDLGLS